MAEQLEEKVILKADSTEAVKSIKDLKDNVRAYRKELDQLEIGSEEYNDTLQKMVQSQTALNNVNKQAKVVTTDLASQLGTITNAARGVAAGFQGVVGAMSLFAGENEDVAKSIQKVQAAMAITQSLTALAGSVRSLLQILPALRAAFSGLLGPIGLVIAAITAVIAIIPKNNSNIEALTASYDVFQRSVDNSNDALRREINVMRAAGATEQELLNARIKANQDLTNKLAAEIRRRTQEYMLASKKESKVLEDQIANLKKQWTDALSAGRDLENEQEVLVIKARKKAEDDALAAQQDAWKRQQAERQKQRDEELKAEEAYNQSRLKTAEFYAEQNKKALEGDSLLNYINAELEINEQARKEAQARAADETATYTERAAAQAQYLELLKQQVDLEAEQEELQTQIREAEALHVQQMTELEAAMQAIQNPLQQTPEERLQWLYDEAATQLDVANNVEQSYEIRMAALKKYEAAQKEAAALDKKLAADEKKIQQEQLKATASFLNSASTLIGEKTAAGKAMSVASAIINTYQAGTVALASAPPPANYALLAATIATGLATVRQILSTDVPGASGGGDTGISAASLPTMPEVDTSAFEVYSTMNPDDVDNLNQVQPVLVVEDVNEVQNRVRVAESSATF